MLKFKFLLLSMFMVVSIKLIAFTVYSQNILGPNTFDVKNFDFKLGDYSRIDELIKKAVLKNADFLCFQEFDKNLSSYKIDGYDKVSFKEKGNNGGVVIYSKHNAKLLGQGGLSIDKLGSIAYALFNIGNKKVLIASVHISRINNNQGEISGDSQWTQFIEYLKNSNIDLKDCHIVIIGDFNTFYPEVAGHTTQFVSNVLKQQMNMYEHKSWTVFNKQNFISIDHALYSSNLNIDNKNSFIGDNANTYEDDRVLTQDLVSLKQVDTKKYQIDNYFLNNLSDHMPMFITFNFVDLSESFDKKTKESGIDSKMLVNALELAITLDK